VAVCGKGIRCNESDAGRKFDGMEGGIGESKRFNTFQMRGMLECKRSELAAFGKALGLKLDDGVRNGDGSKPTVKKDGRANCGERGMGSESDCVKRDAICKTGGIELFD
jgi:hypothetical protein